MEREVEDEYFIIVTILMSPFFFEYTLEIMCDVLFCFTLLLPFILLYYNNVMCLRMKELFNTYTRVFTAFALLAVILDGDLL